MMHSTQIHFARENLIFNSNSAQKNVSLFICFGKNYLFVWANSGRIMVLMEKYLPLVFASVQWLNRFLRQGLLYTPSFELTQGPHLYPTRILSLFVSRIVLVSVSRPASIFGSRILSISSGGFSMGSMGSAEPINFWRWVLEPINF